MRFLVFFYLAPFLALAWALAHPTATTALMAHFMRQLRLFVIKREGKKAVQELAQMLHAWAEENGYDTGLVEEVVELRKQAAIERLGRKRAIEILGEPTTTERYF